MKIKRIIDITRKIYSDMAIWPGDRGISLKREALIKNGDSCNVSSIDMGLHTGTHLDAPFHFIDTGVDVPSLNLSMFIGNAKVFELKSSRAVTIDDIRNLSIVEGDIVLFKTANSNIPLNSKFVMDFIYIDESAARFLAERKVKTIGVDYLSVDKYDSPDHPAHHILLGNNIGVIEGLYLKDVNEGEYFLSCLPLKIEGAEGSPVRAVLLEVES